MTLARRTRAFTLLEVLLALALVAIVSGAVITLIWTVGDRRDSLARALRDQRTGDILIQRLESDLLAVIAGAGGAGVRGESSSLSVLSRGVWLAPGTPDSRAPVAPDDLQTTEFAFDAGSRSISVSRQRGVEQRGEREPLGAHIARLRFRYFDGSNWSATFDSVASDALPVAVEVAVWFGEPPTQEGIGAAPGDEVAVEEPNPDVRWPAPDRLRIITIPDGPGAAWSRS